MKPTISIRSLLGLAGLSAVGVIGYRMIFGGAPTHMAFTHGHVVGMLLLVLIAWLNAE